jgi:hypothetical protein
MAVAVGNPRTNVEVGRFQCLVEPSRMVVAVESLQKTGRVDKCQCLVG